MQNPPLGGIGAGGRRVGDNLGMEEKGDPLEPHPDEPRPDTPADAVPRGGPPDELSEIGEPRDDEPRIEAPEPADDAADEDDASREGLDDETAGDEQGHPADEE